MEVVSTGSGSSGGNGGGRDDFVPCDVFVSHAGNGGMKTCFALPLQEDLAKLGISCFVDHRALGPGDNADHVMMMQLKNAKLVVVVIDDSHFLSSRYCMEELLVALERHEKKEAVVFPIFLSPHTNFYTKGVELQNVYEMENWMKVLRITGINLVESKEIRHVHVAASIVHFFRTGGKTLLNASQLLNDAIAKDFVSEIVNPLKGKVVQTKDLVMDWQGKTITYTGQMVDGERHGWGVARNLDDNQLLYSGSWSHNNLHGQGKQYGDLDAVIAELGRAILKQPNKRGKLRIEGGFENGKLHGTGIIWETIPAHEEMSYLDERSKEYARAAGFNCEDRMVFYPEATNKIYEGTFENGTPIITKVSCQ